MVLEQLQLLIRLPICAGNQATCSFDVIITEPNQCEARITAGLIALYDFTEGQGTIVRDVSGFGNPIDLTIQDPAHTTWLNNCGLAINQGTIIKSDGPASKLNTAIKQSNELTLEAWVKAENTTQGGPARIATLFLQYNK